MDMKSSKVWLLTTPTYRAYLAIYRIQIFGNPDICLKCTRIADIFASCRKSGLRNTMVTADFRPEVEIWPFIACAMHLTILIWTVRSLWTWAMRQTGRYRIPQNVLLVVSRVCVLTEIVRIKTTSSKSHGVLRSQFSDRLVIKNG